MMLSYYITKTICMLYRVQQVITLNKQTELKVNNREKENWERAPAQHDARSHTTRNPTRKRFINNRSLFWTIRD